MNKKNRAYVALSVLLIAALACSMPGGSAPEETVTPEVVTIVVTATPDESAPPPPEEPTSEASTSDTESDTASATLNQDLNVRSGPGTAYGIITSLAGGTTVEIIGKNSDGSWWLIALPGGNSGWISAPYTTSSNTGDIPVVSAPPPPPTASVSTGSGGGGGSGGSGGGGSDDGGGSSDPVAPPDSDISVTISIKNGAFNRSDAVSYPNGDTTDKVFVRVNGFDSVKTSGSIIYTLTCSSSGATPNIKFVGGAIKSGSPGCNSTWTAFYTNVSYNTTITISQEANGYTNWTLVASAGG